MPRPEGPLDPDAGVIQRFAWELRRLREKAGSPPYRELARRAHYSPATLARAAGGRDLPSLAVTLAYVRACGADPAEWEAEWREVAAEVAPRAWEEVTAAEQSDAAAPYVGLTAFTPEDADRFFGREQLVAELVGAVERHQFLAVFGASGSGKSSLLRAGLLPAVRDECAIVLLTPGAEPESRLGQALDTRPADTEVLLVVDQFEELFTLSPDFATRERFITRLLEVAHEPGTRTRVVPGVRADFYVHCAQHRGLAEALREAQVLVGPMTTDELRAVITGPAVRFGYSIEGALVSRLIGDAAGQPGVLPLVSHALLETWRRRRGNALTLAGYDAAGGMHRAIARTAEQAYASLDNEQQDLARQIFGRLVALGEGTDDTKRRISRNELDPDRNPVTAAVLDTLAGARLLTVDADSVEIAHEALIRAWPRLRDWLTEDRDGLRIHRQLTEAAQAWDSLDRDPGALYGGTRLDLAREWAGDPRHRAYLNALEQAFLDASDRAARRRVRRQRLLVATLAILLVLALAASGLAVYERQTALDQRQTALAGKLAAQSATLADGQPDASMLLAVEAFRQDPTLVEARNTLLSSQSQYFRARLAGHTDITFGVAFSPDGRTLATASDDKTVRLWDTTSRTLTATLTGHTGSANGVAFSPDGRTLATTSVDKTVRLWDTTSRKLITTLTGHTSSAIGVAFSPDGRTLATTSLDKTVRLWDTTNHTLTATLTGHSPVHAVAFSPDGRILATAGDDKTMQLWDVASRTLTATLTGHTAPVNGVAFSPDGRTLATTSDDNTAVLWDISGSILNSYPVRRAFEVVFSPDGRTLATAGDDKTARLWDTTSHKLITTLTGHTDPLFGVEFSPDGRTLATTSDDDTIRLWDTDNYTLTATLTGHTNPVNGVAFSPDGRTLATAGSDKTVRLWDMANRKLITTFTGHTNFVSGVAFSPDGRILATTSDDKTVRLWDLASRTLTSTLADHTASVNGVAFSPDGRTLATTSLDETVRLWDTASRKLITTLTGHTGSTIGVAFSPDGRTLATTSDDETARLWDVASRTLTSTLTGHTAPVNGVAFSPDGRTLATTSDDDTIRLWDPDPARVIANNCQLVGAVSQTQWEQLMPELPYQPTCS